MVGTVDTRLVLSLSLSPADTPNDAGVVARGQSYFHAGKYCFRVGSSFPIFLFFGPILDLHFFFFGVNTK